MGTILALLPKVAAAAEVARGRFAVTWIRNAEVHARAGSWSIRPNQTRADVGSRCPSGSRSLHDRVIGTAGHTGASSIFPAPPREIPAECADMEKARRASRRARRIMHKGLSAQTLAILPKIQEVDKLMNTRRQKRVFEVHPEVS